MKRMIIILAFMPLLLLAQQQVYPQRTAEEEAQKQTERLSRELGLTEQQRDTVYAITLRRAIMRHKAIAEGDTTRRHVPLSKQLQGVLTEQQYKILIDKQINTAARRQQMQRLCNNQATDSLQNAQTTTSIQ